MGEMRAEHAIGVFMNSGFGSCRDSFVC
jgi:hypothetical protein